MIDLKVETRQAKANWPMSRDLAVQILNRLEYGSVTVVVDQPKAWLSATRKRWLHEIRVVKKRRASTLVLETIVHLSHLLVLMETASFTSKPMSQNPAARVRFATAEQLLIEPPSCFTMLVATPTDKEMLYRITSFMPKNSLVVIYKEHQ